MIKIQDFATLANIITYCRIVAAMIIPKLSNKTVLYTVIISAISDGVDGYLARALNQETFLGKILDPIADKILVISGLFFLFGKKMINLKVMIFIIAKELAIVIGAMILIIHKYQSGHQIHQISPIIMGKINMIIQSTYLVMKLIQLNYNIALIPLVITDIILVTSGAVSLYFYYDKFVQTLL